jgi:ABC-type multidrug transport system ATPase subunit
MPALLELDAVSVRHWRGSRPIPVLQDVALVLGAGEFGGVWGDRGAGKTTLAKVAAGIIEPDAGRVLFDGVQLTEDARRARNGALHGQIGLATHRGPGFEDLAAEAWIASTVLTGLSWRAAIKRARVALDRVGAADVGGEPWENLSDGERMLVAIAQAIVRGPRLLVVDDPVAGLGVQRRAEIMELLHAIAADGVTVLMTAAELVDLQGLDQIWSLDDGRVDGPPSRPLATVVPLRRAGGA